MLTARREHVAQRAALAAFVVIVLTFLAGVGTMMSGSAWLSFLMSAGFVAAAVLDVVMGARALARRAEVAG
ncbi:hypothetical protein [Leifsonia sp. P73]|uniref:hypothetical protein n=1 Tax=Leifsonia sp. P73 TaxID=3423959 RepID=UPI003DA38146